MESKLPKPSGLKRPATIAKSVIPTERIRAAAEPCRNLTNFQSIRGRARAISPDVSATVPLSRARLRRSRSACDITALKRSDKPVPAKMPRLNEIHFTAPAQITQSTTKHTTASKSGVKPRLPITGASGPKKTFSATNVTNSGSSTSAVAKATKTITKRIPPYDYKARFNDLLEKFKALKEKYENQCEQINSLENLPEQFEEAQLELCTTKEKLQIMLAQNECLQGQVISLNAKLDSVSNNFTKTKEQLNELQTQYNLLSSQHKDIMDEASRLKEENDTLTESNTHSKEELNTINELLFRSNMERKELHNALMDLRGNIRVFCRVRPPLECEQDKAVCGWNYIDEATVEILNYDLINKNKPGAHTFNFDYVFHPGCRQEDVFEMVSPLIQSAMDGYNICIFAYGQTGSGKTYTMDGINENVGVIPRTVDLIFQSVENYKHLGWQYSIKVTFLEIYNEVLYDLLSNEQKDMEIRMAKNSKNDIYVSNITEETVETADYLRELMGIAKMNRATAATIGNERSSRSHAVTRIELIGYHSGKKESSIGTINLVDLAGSESPKTSIRMNETKNINRSLSELTNVILALLQKQDHIPYRNSKLTHLLMPSLGGNSKTLMFINVAPLLDCYVESVKSLRFAASVNSCKVAKAKRNRFLNTSNSSGSSEK